ncbi:MAG: hypothetical protein LRY73_14680 [Bacillus sp. (in: Bacteria)]|nr:hypothetical protein [Bacillus sp. (in: firmicutes)]
MYESKKLEAQELLRDIQQIQVIPMQFAGNDILEQAIERWKKAITKMEKRKARQEIEQYSVGVNKWRGQKYISEFPYIKGLYYIESTYCNEMGLLVDKEMDPYY